MRLAPIVVVGQVELAVGVNDTAVPAVDLGCVLALQEADSHLNGAGGQVVVGGLVGVGQGGTAGNLALGILDDGAGVQHFAGDGVQGAARLGGNCLGGNDQDRVDGGQHEHIGQGHIAAVLLDGGGDGGHGQALAVGSDTLGERSSHFGESVPLAELDGLTAVLGDGMLLGEHIMHQLRLYQVDQVVGVVHFHFVSQAIGSGGLGVGLAVEQVEVHCQQHKLAHSFHCANLLSWREEISIRSLPLA